MSAVVLRSLSSITLWSIWRSNSVAPWTFTVSDMRKYAARAASTCLRVSWVTATLWWRVVSSFQTSYSSVMAAFLV